MAYVKNYSPDDDNTETGGVSETPTISSSVGSASTSEQQAGAPAKQTGTGFGGLQKYLQANQQGGANLGQAIAGKVQEKATAAENAIVPAAQQFAQQVEQGTNIFNPNAAEGDTSNIRGYAGPENFAGSQQDLDIQQKIQAAQEIANRVQTDAGRTDVLRNLVPGTTQGGANLNDFLLKNTGGWNTLAGAAGAAQGLGGQYNAVTGELMNRVQQAKQTSDMTRQQALARQNELYQGRLQAEAAQQAQAQAAARAQQEAVIQQQAAAAQAQQQQAAQAAAAQEAARAREAQIQQEALAAIQAQQQAQSAAAIAPMIPPATAVRENAPNVVNESKPVVAPAPAPAPKAAPIPYDKKSGTYGKGMDGYMVPSTYGIVGISGDNEVYGYTDKYGNRVDQPTQAAAPSLPWGQGWYEPTGGA